MEELKDLFRKLGYTEEEYMEIINTYSIASMKPETLMRKVRKNYNFLMSLGYSKEEVIQTTTTTIVTTTKSNEELKNNNTSILSFVITIILVIALIAKIVSFKIKNMK